jgi:hypothetical protein
MPAVKAGGKNFIGIQVDLAKISSERLAQPVAGLSWRTRPARTPGVASLTWPN